MSKLIDLTGQRFGRLTVIKLLDERSKHGEKIWLCKCDCGNEKKAVSSYLRSGETKSCGCYQKEMASKFNSFHHLSKHKLYRKFMKMIARCENPNNPSYKDYGARGITICKEWREDFMKFYEWSINNGYSEDLSIDRIDNDKGYSPDNCRWTTKLRQNNNRRTSRYLEYDGKRMTIADWGRETGIHQSLIGVRINKLHWSVEKALTTPPINRPRKDKKLTLNGEQHTLEEWAEIINIDKKTLQERRDRGWSELEILTTPYRYTRYERR